MHFCAGSHTGSLHQAAGPCAVPDAALGRRFGAPLRLHGNATPAGLLGRDPRLTDFEHQKLPEGTHVAQRVPCGAALRRRRRPGWAAASGGRQRWHSIESGRSRPRRPPHQCLEASAATARAARWGASGREGCALASLDAGQRRPRGLCRPAAAPDLRIMPSKWEYRGRRAPRGRWAAGRLGARTTAAPAGRPVQLTDPVARYESAGMHG